MILVAVPLAVVLAGGLATASHRKWLGPVGVAVLAPSTGIALFLAIGTILLAVGRFDSLVAAGCSVAVGSALLWSQRGPGLVASARAVMVALAVVGVVAVGTLATNPTRVTPDSFEYLRAGFLIERDGRIDAINESSAVKRLAAVPILQAHAATTDRGYTPVVVPLLGVATAGVLAWLGWRLTEQGSHPRRTALLVGAGTIFLITSNRFLFHAAYINSHMLFALLLLAGFGLALLAAMEDAPSRSLLLPGLHIAALGVVRPESLLVILAFLVPLLTIDGLRLAQRLCLTAPLALVSTAWHSALILRVLESQFLRLVVTAAVSVAIAWGLVGLALMLECRWIAQYRSWMQWGVAAGAAVLLVLFAAADPAVLWESARVTLLNMARHGGWGPMWFILAPLIAVAATRSRASPWLASVAGFVGVLALSTYLQGDTYRIGATDSANRMLFHLVPLLLCWIVVAIGRASNAHPADAPTSGSL